MSKPNIKKLARDLDQRNGLNPSLGRTVTQISKVRLCQLWHDENMVSIINDMKDKQKRKFVLNVFMIFSLAGGPDGSAGLVRVELIDLDGTMMLKFIGDRGSIDKMDNANKKYQTYAQRVG